MRTPSLPKRNQAEFGVQQGLGRWVLLDFGYFIKRTTNAYDFGVLFDTPIAFPISGAGRRRLLMRDQRGRR
jgi:hypothetical protein